MLIVSDAMPGKSHITKRSPRSKLQRSRDDVTFQMFRKSHVIFCVIRNCFYVAYPFGRARKAFLHRAKERRIALGLRRGWCFAGFLRYTRVN